MTSLSAAAAAVPKSYRTIDEEYNLRPFIDAARDRLTSALNGMPMAKPLRDEAARAIAAVFDGLWDQLQQWSEHRNVPAGGWQARANTLAMGLEELRAYAAHLETAAADHERAMRAALEVVRDVAQRMEADVAAARARTDAIGAALRALGGPPSG